jgi:hypothetical protein
MNNNTDKLLKTFAVHIAGEPLSGLITKVEVDEEGFLSASFEGKKRIRRKVNNYFNTSTLEESFTTMLATSMLQQGYLAVTLEDGYVVVSPKGEEYQIHDNECTCPSYLNGEGKCKHIVLVDWLNLFRAKTSLAKQSLLSK